MESQSQVATAEKQTEEEIEATPIMDNPELNEVHQQASNLPERARARSWNLDFIRALAIFMVVGNHVAPMPFPENSYGIVAFQVVMQLCNPLFFSLSGYFALAKKFNNPVDYIRFYGKRFISVIVPVLVFGFFIMIFNMVKNDSFTTIRHFIREYYNGFITGAFGYWFVQYMVGLIVSTPILAKAFQHMKFWELKLVLIICLLWHAFAIFFTANIGLEFGFTGWIMFGYVCVYFIGYYCRVMPEDEKRSVYYILGIVSFVITVYFCHRCYLHQFNNRYDFQPCYILIGLAAFLFLLKNVNIKNKTFGKVCTFIAKHSFTVYLLHGYILNEVSAVVSSVISNNVIFYITTLIITYILSVLAAAAVDIALINPLQRGLEKLLRRAELSVASKNTGEE